MGKYDTVWQYSLGGLGVIPHKWQAYQRLEFMLLNVEEGYSRKQEKGQGQ